MCHGNALAWSSPKRRWVQAHHLTSIFCTNLSTPVALKAAVVKLESWDRCGLRVWCYDATWGMMASLPLSTMELAFAAVVAELGACFAPSTKLAVGLSVHFGASETVLSCPLSPQPRHNHAHAYASDKGPWLALRQNLIFKRVQSHSVCHESCWAVCLGHPRSNASTCFLTGHEFSAADAAAFLSIHVLRRCSCL